MIHHLFTCYPQRKTTLLQRICSQAEQALHFFLDKKTKQKNQDDANNPENNIPNS